MQLSVVVPIYKVERDLERCIDSILKQKIKDMEIILVDDGSPDSCGEICDRYERENKNIIVIHKENGGLSDARNVGIDIARGEYIAFIDSDDTIRPNMFWDMLGAAKHENADIVVCGIAEIEGEKVTNHRYGNRIWNSQEANCAMLYEKKFWVAAWNKIYKRTLFQDMRYPKGRIYEDLYLTPRLIDKADKIMTIEGVYYNYYIRENSIMSVSNKKLNADLIYDINENIIYFKKRKKNYTKEQYQKIYAGLIRHLYDCSRQVYRQCHDNDEYISDYKELIRKELLKIIKNKYIRNQIKIVMGITAFSFQIAANLLQKKLSN